jgi:hypothetical protein
MSSRRPRPRRARIAGSDRTTGSGNLVHDELPGRGRQRAVRGLAVAAAEAILERLDDGAGSATTPAAVVAVEEAPDPTTMFSPAELAGIDPDLIDLACDEFAVASDQARAADRSRRACRKLLDRLPAGRYGAWLVDRSPRPGRPSTWSRSGRTTPAPVSARCP